MSAPRSGDFDTIAVRSLRDAGWTEGALCHALPVYWSMLANAERVRDMHRAFGETDRLEADTADSMLSIMRCALARPGYEACAEVQARAKKPRRKKR